VFVALLISFLWLHFILAQQIESVGREIQIAQEDLDKIRRQNYALQGDISLVGTQKEMAQRAKALNYQPQQPLYLPVDQQLPPSTQEWGTSGLGLFLPGSSAETASQAPVDSSDARQAMTNPP